MSIPSQAKIFFSVLLLVALVAIVPKILAVEAESQSRRIGAFSFQERLDEFTDEDRSLIYSYDENNDNSLDWRCMEDGLNVVVDFETYYTGDEDEDILVRYRFDDKPASEHEYWRLLNNNEAAYIRMNQVTTFTRAALASGEVLMELVDPADDETLRFRIPLNGLREALDQLPCSRRF